jgi:hypothetical protein
MADRHGPVMSWKSQQSSRIRKWSGIAFEHGRPITDMDLMAERWRLKEVKRPHHNCEPVTKLAGRAIDTQAFRRNGWLPCEGLHQMK